MKKWGKWCAAALAAVLTLSLITVPAGAAGPTQKELYNAYYDVLRTETERIGMINDYATEIYRAWWDTRRPGVFHAALLDFDADGVDELMVYKVSSINGFIIVIEADIYTYANGKAVKVHTLNIQEDGLSSVAFAISLRKGSDKKYYLYEVLGGGLTTTYNYYTIVNGQWAKADSLETFFSPDIYISPRVYSSTGTHSYKINGQPVTQAQYTARRSLHEGVSEIAYRPFEQPSVQQYHLWDIIPTGTVNNMLWALGTEVDEAHKLSYTVPSDWAAAQVNAAIAQGIVPESLQKLYNRPITRAEFCALATSFYEKSTGKRITKTETFSDTDDPAVQKMAGLGIVTGVGDGRFNPDGLLTREAAAAILVRLSAALGNPPAKSAPNFADNGSISGWAVESVGQCQAAGIMGGTGDNKFDPQGTYTREQSIVTLMRLDGGVSKGTGLTLDAASLTIPQGRKQTLTASITPADAVNAGIS